MRKNNSQNEFKKKTNLVSCCKRVNHSEDGKANHYYPNAVQNSTLFGAADSEFGSLEELIHGSDTENLTKVAEGVQRIVKHIDDVQEADERQSEWYFAAEVMDLFFLWVVALTFVTLSIAFYVTIP